MVKSVFTASTMAPAAIPPEIEYVVEDAEATDAMALFRLSNQTAISAFSLSSSKSSLSLLPSQVIDHGHHSGADSYQRTRSP